MRAVDTGLAPWDEPSTIIAEIHTEATRAATWTRSIDGAYGFHTHTDHPDFDHEFGRVACKCSECAAHDADMALVATQIHIDRAALLLDLLP